MCGGGGSHSHRSALFFIPPHHTPHHIPQPFRDSSSRIVVAVALLVLSCRRARLTASSACACRRFVTRKSFTVSRLPLRVCGRPRSLCPTEHRHQECRARSSLLLPLHPQACKKGHRGSSGPLPSPTSFPLSKLYDVLQLTSVVHFLLSQDASNFGYPRGSTFGPVLRGVFLFSQCLPFTRIFFLPALGFYFYFYFIFPSHALDFSHIFQLSTNQVPIKYRLFNCQLIKRVRECVACIDSLYAVCARFVRQG